MRCCRIVHWWLKSRNNSIQNQEHLKIRSNAISWALRICGFFSGYLIDVKYLFSSHLLVIFITWNYLAIFKLIQWNDVHISWNILQWRTFSFLFAFVQLWSLIDSYADNGTSLKYILFPSCMLMMLDFNKNVLLFLYLHRTNIETRTNRFLMDCWHKSHISIASQFSAAENDVLSIGSTRNIDIIYMLAFWRRFNHARHHHIHKLIVQSLSLLPKWIRHCRAFAVYETEQEEKAMNELNVFFFICLFLPLLMTFFPSTEHRTKYISTNNPINVNVSSCTFSALFSLS